MIVNLGTIQSSIGRISVDVVDVTLEAQNITTSSPVVGVEAVASYNYVCSLGFLELNEPPYAEMIEITGVLLAGEILTANIINLVIPNGASAGTHIFRWYRASSNQQSGEQLITGAVSSTYTLTEADDGIYIRCEVDLRQIGGVNTSGRTIISRFTDIVASNSFNPVTDIAWETAYIQPDLTRFTELGYWINKGALGNTIAEGTPPTYDLTELALRLTRTSPSVGNHFLYPKKNPTMDQPFDTWIRFKTATLSNGMRILCLTSSIAMWITSSGAVVVSGGSTPNGLIANNTWYKMRIVHSGPTATVQIDGGTIYTIAAGVNTASPSTGNGRIGCDFSKNNHYDGWISHILMKDTPLDNTNRDLMWGWNWNN